MSICVAPVDVVQVHSWWASEHSCGCQPKCTAELNLNRSVSQMSNSSLTISLSGVEISSQKAFKAKCNLCPLSKLSGAVRSCAVLTGNFCVFSISEFGNPNTNRPQMLATVFLQLRILFPEFHENPATTLFFRAIVLSSRMAYRLTNLDDCQWVQLGSGNDANIGSFGWNTIP